ncbi:hypothetical protein AZC_0840 [Azorhizobium caulinodans ORS 571]|uniref:Phage portal protein n=2 Tax=Azorhizobium caulinodans TaxID=7 RepID=A8HTI4_AZOC5|nr:hypothetical protein AZC_0840 [Azorhizobium caulinodans ORS 571]
MSDSALSGAGESMIGAPDDMDMRRFRAWFQMDAAHSHKWRPAAREWYAFVAGDQWSSEEKAALESQQRPAIVFNRSLSIIKAVAGSEINGRQEIHYLPRTLDDAGVNEALTGASKYFADQAGAEDEESDAFQDSLICGMGWTEQRLDNTENPEGDYVEDRIDPLEMFWDRSAKKRNLADARRVCRVRKIPISDARDMFPGFTDAELDATWADAGELIDPNKTVEQKRVRDGNYDAFSLDDDRSEVTLVEFQWWEKERYFIAADPATGQRIELSAKEHDVLSGRLSKLGVQLNSASATRKVYKRAFIGSVVLEVSTPPTGNTFSYACITGERDRNAGTWFGLMQLMRDPQKWANRWLQQALHIMNTNAKGGLLAEEDAFEDQRDAEETWARPDAITWLRKGALSSVNGAKVQPKPQTGIPAGYYQLLEFAISSIRDVTGINLELLGMRDANQPGILEAQRKQAAMTILATAFDSLRRYRKVIGKQRLYFIQNFLSDGRLVRILGRDGTERVIPLMRDTTVGEYDVVIDDAPSAPNQKEANWAIISQMLPLVGPMMTPELWLAVLEYSPLPSALVEKLKTLIPAQGEASPEQKQQAMVALQSALAKIKVDETTAAKNAASAAQSHASAEKTQIEAARLMRQPIGIPALQ